MAAYVKTRNFFSYVFHGTDIQQNKNFLHSLAQVGLSPQFCMHAYHFSGMSLSETKEKKVLTGNSIGFDVKVTWLAIDRMFGTLASRYGISASMGFVLLNINEERGTAATKIAPLLGMEPRSLTRLLKTMEEEKLIFRNPDAKDKRSVRIHLTEKGIESKHIAMEQVGKFDEEVKRRVSPARLNGFFEVLETIYEIAEKNKAGY